MLLHKSLHSRGLTQLRGVPNTNNRRAARVIVASEKAYVPFGSRSPEATAASALNRLFTFAAARIVLAQLEGSGSRGALGAYNKAGFDALSSQLETKIEDADAWVEQLYQKSPEMALRLLDVRYAYASTDFEWDTLKSLCLRDLQKGSVSIMKKQATASLAAAAAAQQPTDAQEPEQGSSSNSSGGSPPSN